MSFLPLKTYNIVDLVQIKYVVCLVGTNYIGPRHCNQLYCFPRVQILVRQSMLIQHIGCFAASVMELPVELWERILCISGPLDLFGDAVDILRISAIRIQRQYRSYRKLWWTEGRQLQVLHGGTWKHGTLVTGTKYLTANDKFRAICLSSPNKKSFVFLNREPALSANWKLRQVVD